MSGNFQYKIARLLGLKFGCFAFLSLSNLHIFDLSNFVSTTHTVVAFWLFINTCLLCCVVCYLNCDFGYDVSNCEFVSFVFIQTELRVESSLIFCGYLCRSTTGYDCIGYYDHSDVIIKMTRY